MADLDETVKRLRELAEGFDAGKNIGDHSYRRAAEADAKLLRDVADFLVSSVAPVGEEGPQK